MKNKNVHKKLVYFWARTTFFLWVPLYEKSFCVYSTVHSALHTNTLGSMSVSHRVSVFHSVYTSISSLACLRVCVCVCTAIQFVVFIRRSSPQWALSTEFEFYISNWNPYRGASTQHSRADVSHSHFEWFAWCICTLLFYNTRARRKNDHNGAERSRKKYVLHAAVAAKACSSHNYTTWWLMNFIWG